MKPGDSISQYRIIELIGAGAFGSVYRAFDTRLKRDVALKFIHGTNSMSDSTRDKLLREARAAARIDHPAICTIYDVGFDSEKGAFISMLYCEGIRLSEFTSRTQLSIGQRINLFRQMCEGVSAAHALDIIHGDLKPDNILVSEGGRVKILDFGLATLPDSAERQGTNAGSFLYVAPERFLKGEVDKSNDVWSLGVILYETLCGKNPFVSSDDQETLKHILHREVALEEFPAETPLSVSSLCIECLQKDPRFRPESIGDIIDALPSLVQENSGWRHDIIAQPATARPRYLIKVAYIGFALIVAIGCLFLFRTELNKIFGTVKEPRRLRLAVFPTEAALHNPPVGELSKLTQQLLVDQMTGITELGVLDPLSLNSLLEYQFGQSRNIHQPDSLAAFCAAHEIDYIVIPRLEQRQATVKLGWLLKNPQDEVVFRTNDLKFTSEDSLPVVIHSQAQRILDCLYSIRQIKTDPNLQPWLSQQTKNIQAVKAFITAKNDRYNGKAALPMLREAVRLDSTFVAARIWLLSSIVQQQYREEAEREYSILLRQRTAVNLFNQTMIDYLGAVLHNDEPNQIVYLRRALEYSPNNNILLINLAYRLALHGDYAGALHQLEAPISMRWEYPALYWFAAYCHCMTNNYRTADSLLTATADIAEKEPMCFGVRAAMSYRMNDSLQAIKNEQKYVIHSIDFGYSLALTYDWLAELFIKMSLPQRALRFALLAERQDRKEPRYITRQAEALLELHDSPAAFDLCSKALRMKDPPHRTRYIAARALERMGDTARAINFFRSFLLVESTTREADTSKIHLSYLLRARSVK